MARLTYRKRITRDMLRAERDTLFVFGDNMARKGFGGQAAEARGEPNAVGIPTKWRPGRHSFDYFVDGDFTPACVEIDKAFDRLAMHPGPIVWPADNIGTGLADLPNRAPRIFAHIEERRIALSKGETNASKGGQSE